MRNNGSQGTCLFIFSPYFRFQMNVSVNSVQGEYSVRLQDF